MARNIKGITIELGADTTSFNKALKSINQDTNKLQAELKQVNAALKLDPTNTELLSQKQKLLSQSVEQTTTKLNALKQAKDKADVDMANGTEVNQEQYRKLQREIVFAEENLKKLESQTVKTNQAFEKVTNGLDKFGKGTESLGKKMMPLSGGASALVGGLVTMGVKAGKSADDINTLAKQTGLTTEQIQKFAYASDIIDVPLETFTSSLAKLTKNMQSAKNGSKNTQEAFETLGVSYKDSVTGELRSNQDVFNDCIDALGKMENETQRDAYAMQIFGKSAQDLNPLILGGSEALEKMSIEAENAGLILSQEALDGANEFNDAIDDLKATTKGTFAKVGTEIARMLIPIMEKLSSKIKAMLSWFKSLNKDTLKTILNIGLVVAAIGPLLILIGKMSTGISSVIKVVKLLWMAISTNPIGAMITAVSLLIVGLTTLAIKMNKETDSQKLSREEHEKKIKVMQDENQGYRDLKESQQKKMDEDLNEIDHTQKLWKELQTLTDENGNVQKSNENRAKFIITELNKAMGLELEMTNGQIKGYKESSIEIDKLLKKKKAQIILDSQEPLYKKAVLDVDKKVYDQSIMALDIADKIEQIDRLENAKAYAKTNRGKKAIADLKQQVSDQQRIYNENDVIINDYYKTIEEYQNNATNIANGNYDAIKNNVQKIGGSYKESGKQNEEELKRQVAATGITYAELQQKVRLGVKGVTQEMVNEAKTSYDTALIEYEKTGNAIPDGLKKGIDLKSPNVFQSIGNFIKGIKDWFTGADGFDIHSPSRYMETIGVNIFDGLLNGFKNTWSSVSKWFGEKIGWIKEVISSIFSSANSSSGKKLFPDFNIPKIPFFAKGGTLTSGQAIVAEAGPELIQMSNGRTTVTPLSESSRNTAIHGSSDIDYNRLGQVIASAISNMSVNIEGKPAGRILTPFISEELAFAGR